MPKIIDNPRELILNEAKDLLYKEGYSSISIRRVAKECDIAVGTIYNYFPTKKELIVEMMTNFWEEFFHDVDIVLHSTKDFYEKLREIFNNISEFIRRFRETWLRNELYSSPDYIESGVERQNIYIDKLIAIVEEMLGKEMDNKNKESLKDFNSNQIAKFIVMNFIAMVQMPYLDYESFEKILKALIK